MNIPKELKGRAISLTHLGVKDVAWAFQDALFVINYFEKESTFVLSGDVLEWIDNQYRYNYDNWYFQPNQGSYKESLGKAREYINHYPKGIFAFVFVTEQ